jgi:hypothetical protein
VRTAAVTRIAYNGEKIQKRQSHSPAVSPLGASDRSIRRHGADADYVPPVGAFGGPFIAWETV